MTDSDVKKIKDVVSELLEPINEKLDKHTELLESHTTKLDEHSAKLDNHTEALMTIEATLKCYGDMYEVNKDKIEDLDQRVTTVEEHLNLTPQK